MDRHLIAEIVEREMRRNPSIGTWPKLEGRSGVSRATLYRLRNAEDNVQIGTLERVEGALGMPTDTLKTAGLHDFDGLAEIGVSDDLIRWIGMKVKKRSSADASGVSPRITRTVNGSEAM